MAVWIGDLAQKGQAGAISLHPTNAGPHPCHRYPPQDKPVQGMRKGNVDLTRRTAKLLSHL